jgi:hypothetical protein
METNGAFRDRASRRVPETDRPRTMFEHRRGLTTPKDEFDMAREPFIKILPTLTGRYGAPIVERFWEKVDKRGPDECWDWTASCSRSGYGRFKLSSYAAVSANRVALALETGEEPKDMQALHSCDRPICCNPAHLRWGTTLDNMLDKIERGRCVSRDQSGAKNGAAKIDEKHLELIVSRFRSGWNNKQIARDLPIGHAMVSKIRCGHMWRDQARALGWPSPRLTSRDERIS